MGKWFVAANGIIGGMQRIGEPPVRSGPSLKNFASPVQLLDFFFRTGRFWSVDPCKGYQCHRADVPFFDTKLRNCWFKLKVIRPENWARSILCCLNLTVPLLLNLNIFSDIAVVAHSQTRLKNFMSLSFRVILSPLRTVRFVPKIENV